ncbi:unnamed protein product, partial [Penicillium discolor]
MVRAMRRAAGPTKTRSLKPRRLASREPGALGLEVTLPAYLRRVPPFAPCSRGLARPVQGHDAEGEVAVGDVLPAGLPDPCGQPLLVGPVADRLVQIVVGVAVRSGDPGHAREHLRVVEP